MASKGKTGKVGLLVPDSKTKLQEDSTPDNTRLVALNNLEVDFTVRAIRLKQNPSFKDSKGGDDFQQFIKTRKCQQPSPGARLLQLVEGGVSSLSLSSANTCQLDPTVDPRPLDLIWSLMLFQEPQLPPLP